MSESTCPICHRPTDPQFRPFCSRHCADVDLGRWFSGTYRVPSFRQDNDEEQDEYRDGEG
ncbi:MULTISPECIES: DNA gyrase inhibitor YacG [Gluconobacter]|uniref:DNA gyrase inhibitor YacG n=3 Tax=Gluconobacter TaxID=441 RepID=A0A149TLQ6_9PROT|nr:MULTISPECIES: DNA gyrase inhibitor YacG [Gluconobacter]AQS91684.1 DNA gyrase inhibitor [Gluconobacter albidus]KXV36915.1 DNA gyrase inhibitor [Gluconobacter albidus]KXV49789.1 DNA gyrase inhibitor [Gluconobacter albidus]MBF0887011.1 DNA gyrase inhibitor YacG [Gluconobacter cadivus]MBN3867214.1 DNA gyrase inhibitor YacG [Gluconobacter kondonii]